MPKKGDVFGVCIDVKNSTYYINLNNKLFCRYIPQALDLLAMPDELYVLINALRTDGNFTEYTVNFGATPLHYTPPEGYKSFQELIGYQEIYLAENNTIYGIQNK